MTLMADYTITETLQEDDGSALYRATSKRDRHSVLLKTLVQSGRPQSREIARLRHECTLVKGLDLPTVLKVEACDAFSEQPVLVMEDFGGDLSDYRNPTAGRCRRIISSTGDRIDSGARGFHSHWGWSTETSSRELHGQTGPDEVRSHQLWVGLPADRREQPAALGAASVEGPSLYVP